MSVITWFNELSQHDVSIAGNEGARIASLLDARLPVPPGFIVSSEAHQFPPTLIAHSSRATRNYATRRI